MKRITTLAIGVCLSLQIMAQASEKPFAIDTTNLDFKALASKVVGSERNSYKKAVLLLKWVSHNFNWLATDYNKRTVKEIIARGGGNCFELAQVYKTLILACGVQQRGMAEINIHKYSTQRQRNAEELIKKRGNMASVFGLQHNDHRWLEVYDEERKIWEPADPAVGVVGITDWLKARVWFGERHAIDTSITNVILVPIAVFYTDDKSKPAGSRSDYYLIEQFNALYNGELSSLPLWNEWTSKIKNIQVHAKKAFLGEENFHRYQKDIADLAVVYTQLKKEFSALQAQKK